MGIAKIVEADHPELQLSGFVFSPGTSYQHLGFGLAEVQKALDQGGVWWNGPHVECWVHKSNPPTETTFREHSLTPRPPNETGTLATHSGKM